MSAGSHMSASSDMGVTGNAVLLLGYIAGALGRADDYEVEEVNAAGGTQVIRHRRTGNLYAIAVRQLEGTE